MESAQDQYKKWGIALVIFLLVLIPAEIYLLRQAKKGNESKPTIKNTEVAAESSHPTLYSIELEYDPVMKTTKRIDSGVFKGDKEDLALTPSSSDSFFNYKIDTYSSSGELLSSGWVSKSKFVISTSEGKYRFRATISYVPNETITVSDMANKILWSGKII